MEKNKSFPLVSVKGNNYIIGKQIGKHFKERILKALKECNPFKEFQKLDKERPERINQVESLAKMHFPQFIKEIQGLSDGCGVEYRDILIANFRHVPLKDEVENNCTSVFFINNNEIILAHNEDFESIMGKYSYFSIMELENGTKIFSHSYPGCIPGISFGVNSHGIVMTTNGLTEPKKRIGLSRILFGRAVLESKTIKEAIHNAQSLSPRSGGASYNIVSMKEKRAVNLETTADDAFLTEITDKYFHTNHYISEKFKHISHRKLYDSTARYKRGSKLLPELEKTEENALKLLSDRYIFFNSLKSPTTGFIFDTIYTAIFKITDTIHLKLYPHEREKKEYTSISLDDILYFKMT